jgi:carbon monoxide dehydrogenase subunit G
MQIENEFDVAAPPDHVYAFLLDVNRVVTCMPGAELSEVVDRETFKGKVKIKVGPITVSYNGTARIAERDEASHRAVLQAEGRETTGPGSARATAVMTVEPADEGSKVHLATDFNVAGRVANFGRGVMEDVSRRLVSQMADCIKSNLESAEAEAAAAQETPAAPETPRPAEESPAAATPTPAPVPTPPSAPAPASEPASTPPAAAAPTPAPAPAATPAPAARQATAPTPAKPVNALSLFFAVIWDRIKRLFRRR